MNAAFFFEDFCAAVCERVRFKPDRGKIRDELMDHLTDRLEALTAQGMDWDEARAAAVAAMGDPAAIGDALDRLHSPGMGWLLVWLGRAARVMLVLALLTAVRYSARLVGNLAAPAGEPRLIISDLESEHLVADLRSTTVCRTEDYVFTVERAVITRYDGRYTLTYLLKAAHSDPWLRGPDFTQYLAAEDDLGRRYPSRYEQAYCRLPTNIDGIPTGDSAGNKEAEYPFVTYYELWVSDINGDARSVTVFFDRYGERAFSLLIPLEGGEDA